MVNYPIQAVSVRWSEPRELYASELEAMRRNREKERRREQMAFIRFTRETNPVAAVGKRVSVPEVLVTGKGRLQFSKAASKAFDGKPLLDIHVDYDTHSVYFVPLAAAPKGVKEDLLWGVTKASKGGNVSISGISLLTWKPEVEKGKKPLPALYDYKSAGNQRFPVVLNDKGQVVLRLPEKTPAPLPVVKRAPRKAKAEGAAPATAAVAAEEPALELA